MIASARTRNLLLRWALPIVGVLLLTLITWLAGGFRPGSAVAGPQAALGRQLELRRWLITRHDRVVLTDVSPAGVDQDPALRIKATVELTADESVSVFPQLIDIRKPVRMDPADRKDADYAVPDDFDPDIPAEQIWDFPWSGKPVPEQIVITVRDEKMADNFLYGEDWATGDVTAVITAPVVDERTRR